MPKYVLTKPYAIQGRPASCCRQRHQHNGLVPLRLVLQMLSSFVANGGRENVRRRQAEGIAAAKVKGVRFGREPSPLPKDFSEIYTRWRKGLISTSDAAKRCGMARSTFRYRAEIFEKDAEETT